MIPEALWNAPIAVVALVILYRMHLGAIQIIMGRLDRLADKIDGMSERVARLETRD